MPDSSAAARLPMSALLSHVLPLPWLLARVLLSVAVEFERESKVSLAIATRYRHYPMVRHRGGYPEGS